MKILECDEMLARNAASNIDLTASAPDCGVVLKEVLDLLEEFGPHWYTEEQNKRIVSALSGRYRAGL
jgi:hypothetical protein